MTMYDPETFTPFTIVTTAGSVLESQGGIKSFLQDLERKKAGKVFIYDLKSEPCTIENKIWDIRHTFRYATRPLKEDEKVIVYKEIEEEIYL